MSTFINIIINIFIFINMSTIIPFLCLKIVTKLIYIYYFIY